MMKRSWFSIITEAVVVLGVFSVAVPRALAADPKPASTSLSPEALGAKAVLEDLLARRYSAELATLVDRDFFSLGAQLELISVAPPPSPLKTPDKPQAESEPINDLMLGTLDPEALMKAYSGPIDDRSQTAKMFDHFRIRTVAISVGLKDSMSGPVRVEVDNWLKKRVAAEFGKAGRGNVAIIKTPLKAPKETPVEKTYWDWLMQFQSLAGQIVLASAIIMGIILWQILSKPFEGFSSDGVSDQSDFAALQQAAAEVAADTAKEEKFDSDFAERESARFLTDIEVIKQRLVELVPKLQGYFEEIVRNWCLMGDSGRLRLACFAEVAGKEIGKLPIPVDALPEVQKIFQRMPEIESRDKRDALQRAYWDLLSVLNLGSDSLSQPFSYLDGLNITMVNRVLMDQNPKLKTVVSLYMSDDLRTRYMRSLTIEQKKELLKTAAELSDIRSDELETLDRGLMARINPTLGQEIVPLDMTLAKLVSALTPIEEISLLGDMKGAVIEAYKRSVPSLAFLHEWPDDKLNLLLMGITPDELISYLRARPDMKSRLIELASMMVREIANDELSRPDKMQTSDKEQALSFFNTRLKDLIQTGEVNLEQVFGPLPTTVHQLGVTNEGEENGQGPKKVA